MRNMRERHNLAALTGELMELREIMTSPVVTLSPAAKVAEARWLMREHNMQHLPVVDSGELVGIISDRDIHVPRLLGQWNAFPWIEGVSVKWLMSSPLSALPPTARIAEAAKTMRDDKVGCVAVVQQGELLGIVTITDLLNLLDPASGALVYGSQVHRVSEEIRTRDAQ